MTMVNHNLLSREEQYEFCKASQDEGLLTCASGFGGVHDKTALVGQRVLSSDANSTLPDLMIFLSARSVGRIFFGGAIVASPGGKSKRVFNSERTGC
jgi:hypothetical protein